MSVRCIDRAWRRRAVTERLAGVVVALVVAVILFVAALFVDSTVAAGLALAGNVLIVAGVVHLVASRATIGGGQLAITVEGRRSSRDDEIRLLVQQIGPSLIDVGKWLSNRDERVAAWATQACTQAYHDCFLVPRERRELHLMCLFITVVRRAMSLPAETLPSPTWEPPLTPVHLLSVPFDDRAAWVLRRVGYDNSEGAHLLHCTPTDFSSRADRVESFFANSGMV